jgi:hypothetical protein
MMNDRYGIAVNQETVGMRMIFIGLLGIFLCTNTSYASSQSAIGENIASRGVTIVKASFGKTNVSVKITTHEIDIGKPGDGRPDLISSNCTYSRYPCSTVDDLEISVNGKDLSVARSVYADLADLSKAVLRVNKKKQFILKLVGGDASESYTLEVTFDGGLVRQRTLTSNEAQHVMQKASYF